MVDVSQSVVLSYGVPSVHAVFFNSYNSFLKNAAVCGLQSLSHAIAFTPLKVAGERMCGTE